jgi:ADP-heptose:LPS heptosyltransferase
MKKTASGQRILIAKTTHLGDVVISLPMAASLKHHLPDSTVLFLTHPRTVDVAARCMAVDAAYAQPETFADLVALLVDLQVDVFVQANNSEHLAKAAKAANIPVRIGSLFRWYNWWLCTHRVAISRGHKHLNKRLLDLEYLQPLGIAGHTLGELPSLYAFSPPDASPLIVRLGLNLNKRRIILHPTLITSKAHQWPLAAYQALMRSFDKQQYQWVITGTAADRDYLEPLLLNDNGVDKVDTVGLVTLDELVSLMQSCDGLVAGSTGPVHLAAALGINTLGFYQSNPAIFRRWAPVGRSVTVMQGVTPCWGDKGGKACPCVQNISPQQVKAVIDGWFAP